MEKISSKWIKDLNAETDTIKLPEENISQPIFDINCSSIFLDLSPSVMNIKTKIQPIEWEKIFANDATDKELTPKIYKQLIQLII